MFYKRSQFEDKLFTVIEKITKKKSNKKVEIFVLDTILKSFSMIQLHC